MCTCMMMIKSGALFIYFLFAFLTTVQSSSLPLSNIIIGSSIYTSASSSNQTSNSSYWLSPSGVFAFGFYPLCYNCDQYKVAIWINRPSNKVVVWSNNNNETIYSGSSIQLSHDGLFTINQPAANSTTTKPLFTHTLGLAAYALMQDTGNFVVYDSASNIVWQSFDYPSDTLLQGQTLKPGESIVNPVTNHKLIMQKYGNLELIEQDKIRWQSKTRKEGGGIVLSLDSVGHMNLVNKDGIVIKKLTKDKKQNKASNGTGSLDTTFHRATLESDGVFRLYAERIGPPTMTHESKNSVLLWESYCKKCDPLDDMSLALNIMYGVLILILVVPILISVVAYLFECCRGAYRSCSVSTGSLPDVPDAINV